MPDTALGLLLRTLREKRGLSLRELARLAQIDHAYIHRLETGAKEAPSPDVLAKLVKALKPGKREAEMLQYLSEHTETAAELVDLVLKDQTVNFDVFAATAGMAFRGKRPNYAELIQRVRRFLADEGDNG